MQLEHAFTVPTSVDAVWEALLDPERVAPCMPGATLTGVDGATFTGKVKVKLGPVSMQYKGTGEYVDTDEARRTVVIEASGKDARGNGTASATVTLHLTGDSAKTEGTTTTDLTVTGKPAQFGRGMISDVSGKILEQFAANLADELGGPASSDQPASPDKAASTAAAPTAAGPTAGQDSPAGPAPTAAPGQQEQDRGPARETEPLDLTEFAGSAVAKRAVPLIGVGAVAAIVAIVILRICRSRAD